MFALVVALSPVFRYSYSRDAYILRAVGTKRGPVLADRRRFSRGEERMKPSRPLKTR